MAKNEICKPNKNIGIEDNVVIRTINPDGSIGQTALGHNAATNSMLYGIAKYLVGDGVLNQGQSMLTEYIPRYISLGTMGLISQDEDDEGLPDGIGVLEGYTEEERFIQYMDSVPGYGADGWDATENNGREYFGLGPKYEDRADKTKTINCELISDSFPRELIAYREIMSEDDSELPQTIDVIYSGMISVGALAAFRETDRDYVFITEAGLWSDKEYKESGSNGLLAGYRIVPADRTCWDMTKEENRKTLKQSVLKVCKNQVVQVIWKIQLGAIKQLFPYYDGTLN